MEQIIKDLAAATEGSRKLDEAISRAFATPTNERGPGYWHDDSCQPGTGGRWLKYSYSIDAALTLVPEGYCGELEFGPVKNGRRYGAACVGTKKGPVEGLNVTSPALALCIAALKARKQTA